MNKEKTITIICLAVVLLMFSGIIPTSIYKSINKAPNTEYKTININWQKIYPSMQTKVQETADENNAGTIKKYTQICDKILDTYTSIFNRCKTKGEKFLNDNIPGRIKIAEVNGKFEKLINKKLITGSDSVISMKNDYLTYFYEKNSDENLNFYAKNVIDFNTFLKDLNTDFLYIQLPHKINKYGNKDDLRGYKDYSNENADIFISMLEKGEVNTLDLRENMHKAYPAEEYLSLFYKTDHHWLPSTGIWATKEISTVLNDNYNFNIDLASFDKQNYEVEKYDNYFLGSQGKKVTLGYSSPEDFELFSTKAKTNYHVIIPQREIDTVSNAADALIDKAILGTADYYNANPYAAYGYGDQALITVDNLYIDEGKDILLIRDSYSDCILPFFAQGVNKVTAIDLRTFNGSVKSFIDKEKPDMVIMMYIPAIFTHTQTHEKMFMMD